MGSPAWSQNFFGFTTRAEAHPGKCKHASDIRRLAPERLGTRFSEYEIAVPLDREWALFQRQPYPGSLLGQMTSALVNFWVSVS